MQRNKTFRSKLVETADKRDGLTVRYYFCKFFFNVATSDVIIIVK